MTFDSDLRALARAQRCAFTTTQAVALGASEGMLRQRVRNGSLVRLAPRVFVIGGAPITDEVLLLAAWLECGGRSALSHETAAAHWGFPGFTNKPIQLLRRRDGTFPPVSLGRVRTTRELPDTQIVDADGLLVTTPARTLFDLAPRIHPGRLEKLLDRAWSRRLVDWRIMHRTLLELRRRGRAGIRVMRDLLEVRPVDYVPPDSNLEARFRQVLRDGFQPEMDRQVNVGNDVAWLGRVDFVDRAKKVIVEVQSDLHHTSVSDRQADEARICALTEAGWQIVEIPEFELWYRPTEVRRKVRAARSGR